MLVLTRRLDESIKIGVDIEIKVIDIKGNAVRIGINAPKDVSVHRKEIYDIIQKENVLAAQKQAVKEENTLKKLVHEYHK